MGVAEREEGLDTELDQGNDADDEGQEGQGEGGEEAGDGEGEGTEGAGEEETVVTLGEEEPPASEEEKAAPKWVKDLRERQRVLARENAELKAKLSTGQPGAPQKPTLPPKPKIDDPDIDFDVEKFEQARDAWDAKKRDVDAWEATQRTAEQAQQKRVQAINESYEASKKALAVKDYQDAEDEAAAQLDQMQQGILKAGATNPAALVYALGRTPKKLAELASIKDPVKFAVAVGKLETEVKVTKRTSTKPAPETAVKGSGSASTSTATLDRLRAEAAKTGDLTKVVAYKKQMKTAGK